MALRPCTLCRKTYRGAALHMYPALVTESASYSQHLRLCKDDFENLLSNWANNDMNATETLGDAGERPKCPFCWAEVPTGDRAQFFCTSYTDGDIRADWWAPVHDECAPALRGALDLSTRPL